MKKWLIGEPGDADDVVYFYEVLIPNGLISVDLAKHFFFNVRFEYNEPDCPFCGCVSNHWVMGNKDWKCKYCKKKFSQTTRSALQNKKITYHELFRVIWLITEMKITKSEFIAQDVGITQKTAWLIVDMIKNHFGVALSHINYVTVILGLIKPNKQPKTFELGFNYKKIYNG